MNIIRLLMSGAVQLINKMIDGIDIRTQQTIKEGFFFIIFILCIGAIFFGYNLGKQAAKPAGKSHVETTNDVFDLHIKMSRDPGTFQSMLTQALLQQQQFSDTKAAFPARGGEVMTMPAKPVDIPQHEKEIQRVMQPIDELTPAEPHTPASIPAVVKPIDAFKEKRESAAPPPLLQPQSIDTNKKDIIIPGSKELKPLDRHDKVLEQ